MARFVGSTGRTGLELPVKIAHTMGSLVLCLVCVPAGGCDESLPPRTDPLAVLEAGFSMNAGVVVVRDSLSVGLDGAFQGSLENLFTEVLEDSEHVRLVVDVCMKGKLDQRTRAIADRNNLSEKQYLHGDILVLEPHKPIHIILSWSHRTDAGVWYWAFGPMAEKFSPKGERFLESLPITLVVEATVQCYKKIAPRHLGPFEFSVTYRVF